MDLLELSPRVVGVRLLVAGPGLFLLFACQATDTAPLQSVFTDLAGNACKQETDKGDPNETPFLECPGVGGYTVIVRKTDAGRKSIDIVDPAKRVFPLRYDEFVTRDMSELGARAEWRIADGKPVALIVRVRAHEDAANPEKVTRSYFAVAKITESGICVTDRIPEETKTEIEIRNAADSAPKRECAPPVARKF